MHPQKSRWEIDESVLDISEEYPAAYKLVIVERI